MGCFSLIYHLTDVAPRIHIVLAYQFFSTEYFNIDYPCINYMYAQPNSFTANGNWQMRYKSVRSTNIETSMHDTGGGEITIDRNCSF
jgi:hypothetical protein